MRPVDTCCLLNWEPKKCINASVRGERMVEARQTHDGGPMGAWSTEVLRQR